MYLQKIYVNKVPTQITYLVAMGIEPVIIYKYQKI